MDYGLADRVVDKLHQRRQKVLGVLKEQYKRTKPFRAEPIPNEFHVKVYENMTPEDLDYAVQTYGRDAVNEWMFEVNKIISRRQSNDNGIS